MTDLKPANGIDNQDFYNNPAFAAFLGLGPGDILDLGEVPTDTNISEVATGIPFTPQGPFNMLAALRAQFPYVPIIPWPPSISTVALVQNVAQELVVPDMVQFVMFRGSGNYYVSRHGNAETPVNALGKSIYKPEGFLFYSGGMKSFSCITPDAAGCVVTMLGYAPTELPRYGG